MSKWWTMALALGVACSGGDDGGDDDTGAASGGSGWTLSWSGETSGELSGEYAYWQNLAEDWVNFELYADQQAYLDDPVSGALTDWKVEPGLVTFVQAQGLGSYQENLTGCTMTTDDLQYIELGDERLALSATVSADCDDAPAVVFELDVDVDDRW
jgi:hypothetical protein